MYCDKGMENKAVFLRTEDKIDEQLIQFEGHGVAIMEDRCHTLPGLYCFSFPLSLRCKSLPFPLGVADSLFAAAQFVAPPPLPDVAPAALAAGSSHRGEMGGT